ncbi:MAG: hypothetical protein H0U90_00640 [Actinobacteria bacterium]|nr:hypothetical protein [Actinomycetota bacterium]
MSEDEAGRRLQELLARLDGELAGLESTEESEVAVERLAAMADIAREVQAEIDRLRREAPDAHA